MKIATDNTELETTNKFLMGRHWLTLTISANTKLGGEYKEEITLGIEGIRALTEELCRWLSAFDREERAKKYEELFRGKHCATCGKQLTISNWHSRAAGEFCTECVNKAENSP